MNAETDAWQRYSRRRDLAESLLGEAGALWDAALPANPALPYSMHPQRLRLDALMTFLVEIGLPTDAAPDVDRERAVAELRQRGKAGRPRCHWSQTVPRYEERDGALVFVGWVDPRDHDPAAVARWREEMKAAYARRLAFVRARCDECGARGCNRHGG